MDIIKESFYPWYFLYSVIGNWVYLLGAVLFVVAAVIAYILSQENTFRVGRNPCLRSFIKYPNPSTRKEIDRTVRDLEKQISYMESFGCEEKDIQYYRDELEYLKRIDGF